MIAVALLVVACGTTVEPSTTFVPSATPVPPTPVPSQGRFRPMAYPAEGEAPCGQAEAPDAAHAAYTGQIRRISSTDPETVVFELCGPDVAFRSKIAAPAFAINDTGWLESHIDPATSGRAGDRHRGQRDRAVPARELEPRLRGQPRPQRRLLGRRRP